MNNRKIIDALLLTDSNIHELRESITKQLSDDIVIMRIIQRAAEDYNDRKGSGAFQQLGSSEKNMCICRYAIINGYIEALIDMREAQLSELEAIGLRTD